MRRFLCVFLLAFAVAFAGCEPAGNNGNSGENNGNNSTAFTDHKSDWETWAAANGGTPAGFASLDAFLAWADTAGSSGTVPAATFAAGTPAPDGFAGDWDAFCNWANEKFPGGIPSIPPAAPVLKWDLTAWQTYADTLEPAGIPGITDLSAFIDWTNEKYPDGIPAADLANQENPIADFPGDLAAFGAWAITITEYVEAGKVGPQEPGGTVPPPIPPSEPWSKEEWEFYLQCSNVGYENGAAQLPPGLQSLDAFLAWAGEHFPGQDGEIPADLPRTNKRWDSDAWTQFFTTPNGTEYGGKIGGVSNLKTFFDWVSQQSDFADKIPQNPNTTTGTKWRENKDKWQKWLDAYSAGKIPGVKDLDAFLYWADSYFPSGLLYTSGSMSSMSDDSGRAGPLNGYFFTFDKYPLRSPLEDNTKTEEFFVWVQQGAFFNGGSQYRIRPEPPEVSTPWQDNKELWQRYLDENNEGKFPGFASLDAFLNWADLYFKSSEVSIKDKSWRIDDWKQWFETHSQKKPYSLDQELRQFLTWAEKNFKEGIPCEPPITPGTKWTESKGQWEAWITANDTIDGITNLSTFLTWADKYFPDEITPDPRGRQTDTPWDEDTWKNSTAGKAFSGDLSKFLTWVKEKFPSGMPNTPQAGNGTDRSLAGNVPPPADSGLIARKPDSGTSGTDGVTVPPVLDGSYRSYADAGMGSL